MLAPDILAHEAASAPTPKGEPRPWWEGRPFVVVMILLAFVPLLYPPIPPLVDLGGHMGRYKVARTSGAVSIAGSIARPSARSAISAMIRITA